MIKIQTVELNHCGECCDCDTTKRGVFCCFITKKKIKEIWGEIPKWCPLPEKVET